MESIWDIAAIAILIAFVVVALARLILHFVRPVTWQDGEGPAVNEDRAVGSIGLPPGYL